MYLVGHDPTQPLNVPCPLPPPLLTERLWLGLNVHLSMWVITLGMQHLHVFGIIPKFNWKPGEKKGKRR